MASVSRMQISTNAVQIKVLAHSCATILLEATHVHVMMALHCMIMDTAAMVKGSRDYVCLHATIQ